MSLNFRYLKISVVIYTGDLAMYGEYTIYVRAHAHMYVYICMDTYIYMYTRMDTHVCLHM
jgi:pyruvate/2-oxoacid:ferredoxin oxidoreductase beta subunit